MRRKEGSGFTRWRLIGAIVSIIVWSASVPAGTSKILSLWSVQPLHGYVGDAVTITGPVTGITGVRFNGADAEFSFSPDQSSIVARVPETATTGVIELVTPKGLQDASWFEVYQASPPKITKIEPLVVEPGQMFFVYGSDLMTVTSARIGNLPVRTSTRGIISGALTGYAPTNAISGAVTVTTPFGEATSVDTITVKFPDAPVITGFTPTSGPEDARIEIRGVNLRFVNRVQIGDVDVTDFTPSFTTDGGLTVVIPRNAVSGRIKVRTPAGEAVSADVFTVLPPQGPTITSISIAEAGDVGDSRSIRGTNFRHVTAVKFNGISAQFEVMDSGEAIRTTVPEGAITGPLTLESPFGNVWAPFIVWGTTSSVRQISQVYPAAADIGRPIHINGLFGDGAVGVSFNGAAAVFTSGPTSILAYVPANATTGPITVRTADGTAISPTEFVVQREADISLSYEYFPDGTLVGFQFMALTAFNNGPSAAEGVVLKSTFDQAPSTVFGEIDSGDVSVTDGDVIVRVARFEPGAKLKLTIGFGFNTTAQIVHTTEIAFQTADYWMGNNQVSRTFKTGIGSSVESLQMERLTQGRLLVSWPAAWADAVLERSDSPLASSNWSVVTAPTLLNGNRYFVMLPHILSPAAQFYRVITP